MEYHIRTDDVNVIYLRFLSVEQAAGVGGNSVTARIILDLGVAPAEIRVRLRSNDGRPLKAAEVNGSETKVLEGNTIRLPRKIRGEYRIVGHF